MGAGVIGLVTAWTLLDKGYRVTIIAKEWASYGKEQRLPSQIAGALWEFPPAVCGQHTDRVSLQYSKRWCMVAYHVWDALASSKNLSDISGVRVRPADFFFPTRVEQDGSQRDKMIEIMASGVRGFRHDANIIQERGVNKAYGAVDAYEHLAPVIDTDVCMNFLKDLVASKGAKMVTRTVKGDLFDQEQPLLDEFQADVIVNATGLSGAEVAGDKSCYPIRGALIRVINDGTDFPKLDRALTISADVAGEIVFLVPRNDDILLIGGITEPNQHELDLTLDSPIIKRMRTRCEEFLPDLRKARLDPDYPLAQGLRPFRQKNIRLERELRIHEPGTGLGKQSSPSRIIHNYGHGGAGWSLSFGCAADVLVLVEEALQDHLPQAMRVDVGVSKVPNLVHASKKFPEAQKLHSYVKARL